MTDNKNKYWFPLNTSHTYKKVGVIVDGFYDGLLQVKEIESGKIYIVAPNELELIKNK